MFHGKTFECLSFHFAFGIKAVPLNRIEDSLSGAMVTLGRWSHTHTHVFCIRKSLAVTKVISLPMSFSEVQYTVQFTQQ